MNVRSLRLPFIIAILVLGLSACGRTIEPTPTAAPTATTEEATPVGLTAGTLADRIGEAWTTIDRYRSTTTSGFGGTPIAAETGTTVVEEAIQPDQRRQVVTIDGTIQSEIVAAGGNIYGRGPALPGISQPNRNPDVWITINGNVLGPDNSFSGFYHSLLLPFQPPYAGLSDDKRNRPAEILDTVEIDGQTCQRYRIVDTDLSGERMVIVLSSTENGLVCSIETTTEESVTMTVFEYDQPASIELPASPVAAPAENG